MDHYTVPGHCEKDRFGTSKASTFHSRNSLINSQHGYMISVILASSMIFLIAECRILKHLSLSSDDNSDNSGNAYVKKFAQPQPHSQSEVHHFSDLTTTNALLQSISSIQSRTSLTAEDQMLIPSLLEN